MGLKNLALFIGIIRGDFIGYVKPTSNYINPNFLEKLGMYRQTQITKNKIVSKKITPIINTKKHLFYRRKIPMASKK